MINQTWIKQVFYQMVAIRSDTNTTYEKVIEDALLNILSLHKYFKSNPNHYGAYPLKDDHLNRRVVWCFVKGTSDDTYIMVNHHDAVDASEYGKLKDLAYRPEELKEALKKKYVDASFTNDLEDNRWIFGRGTADMKAGLACQMGVIDFFAEKQCDANIIMLSVPDEETLSKGMLSAVELLEELRISNGFKYKLLINSEPYFNQIKDKAVMYEGSVGKVMPVVYVRGVKSHISDPFAGINPSLILSEIQKRTELNSALCDVQGYDASPPPVWINLKDRKKAYDASIPEAAVGYFNWLTFSRSPQDVLNNMKLLAKHAMNDVLLRHQQAYETFCMLNHQEGDVINYKSSILTFEDIYNQGIEKDGEIFEKEYKRYLSMVADSITECELPLPEVALKVIEFVVEYLDIEGPAVVLGLSGPYYPHISNKTIPNGEKYDLANRVNTISQKKFNLLYQSNGYFMGISDLSYAGFTGNTNDVEVIQNNSPGWNQIYKIPFKAMNKLSMPVLNIGPWGKDLHKVTERVFGPDVFERIPTIISELIIDIQQSGM